LGQGKKEIKQGINILGTFFRGCLGFKEPKQKRMLVNQAIILYFNSCTRLSGEQILQNIALVERAGGDNRSECQQIIDIGNNGI